MMHGAEKMYCKTNRLITQNYCGNLLLSKFSMYVYTTDNLKKHCKINFGIKTYKFIAEFWLDHCKPWCSNITYPSHNN